MANEPASGSYARHRMRNNHNRSNTSPPTSNNNNNSHNSSRNNRRAASFGQALQNKGPPPPSSTASEEAIPPVPNQGAPPGTSTVRATSPGGQSLNPNSMAVPGGNVGHPGRNGKSGAWGLIALPILLNEALTFTSQNGFAATSLSTGEASSYLRPASIALTLLSTYAVRSCRFEDKGVCIALRPIQRSHAHRIRSTMAVHLFPQRISGKPRERTGSPADCSKQCSVSLPRLQTCSFPA